MHLVRGMTSLNTKKINKKNSVKQNRAKEEHDRWLRSKGCHPDQLAQKKPLSKKIERVEPKSANAQIPSNGNGFAPIVAKPSVFDTAWNKAYEDDPLMAEREVLALEQAEEKKALIRPLYNKGPLQYSGNLSDLKEGNGRRTR